MVQRIFNVTKWKRLEEGQVITFDNPRPRVVRLDVNSPGDSELYYIDGAGEVSFLALVRGRDIVEFTTDGAFQLSVSGNDCSIYTADGAITAHKAVDAVSFTRIVERRARNPEFERMQWEMMQNINRRLEQQKNELEYTYRRREMARNAELAAAPVAGDSDDEPAQADNAGSSDTPPA